MKNFYTPAVVEKDWVTESGLRAVVIKQGSPFYHRCGYVGVAEDNGLFGLSYDEIFEHISIHGGLTFSGNIDFVENKLHWFGYDCAHSCDRSYGNPKGVERDLDYCIKECERLSRQLCDSPLSLFYKWKKGGILTKEEHNAMLAFGIRNPQDPLVRQYIENRV